MVFYKEQTTYKYRLQSLKKYKDFFFGLIYNMSNKKDYYNNELITDIEKIFKKEVDRILIGLKIPKNIKQAFNIDKYIYFNTRCIGFNIEYILQDKTTGCEIKIMLFSASISDNNSYGLREQYCFKWEADKYKIRQRVKEFINCIS